MESYFGSRLTNGQALYLMFVMGRIADSTRTLRHVADGPEADMRISDDERNTPLRSKPPDLREPETKRYRGRPPHPTTMRLWQTAQ